MRVAHGIDSLRLAVRALLRSWFFFLLMWVWIFTYIQTDSAARAIGSIFPVVSTISIDTMRPTEVNGAPATVIAGTALKFRNCSFDSMRWYIESSEGVAPVTSFFRDPPEIRVSGVQTWSALIVGVSPDRIDELKAETTHWCGNLRVISKFYPGGPIDPPNL